MSNFVKALVFILSVSVIFIHFKRNESFKIQGYIIQDQRSESYKRDLDFINSIDDFIPSLTLFTMPLKAIKGKYLVENGEVELGIEYLKKSLSDNPFLSYGEAVLADVYERLGDMDKFYEYSSKAIKALPNNPIHFVLYARMMNMKSKPDSIVHHFNIISKNQGASRDPQIYNITMASILNDTLSYQKFNAYNIAKEAKKKFPDNKVTNRIADYILFSKDNVERALELQEKARNLFLSNNVNADQSMILLEEAYDLYPDNQLILDDLINIYSYKKMFKEVLEIYSDYINKYKFVDDVTINHFALALYYSNNVKESCKLFNILINRNFEIDDNIRIFCSSNNTS